MKKLFTLMIAFLGTLIMAQTPESFNYQAVVRDANGNVLPNTQVSFQFYILSGSATGTVVYSEEHSVTTNEYGLVNLKIGEGTVLAGDFSSIDWGANTYFLNIKLDQGGGFEDLGTQQFVSVPYALYAKTAGNAGGTTYTAGNGISITGNVIENTMPDQEVTITGTGTTTVSGTYPNFTISTDNSMNGDVTGTTTNNTVTKIQGQDVSVNPPATGQVLKWNGTEWAPGDDNTTGGSGVDGVVDGASFSGTTSKTLTLSRSNGLTPITANFTDEVDDADADPTNEIQSLEQVLQQGNNAGSSDIDMNNQSVTNAHILGLGSSNSNYIDLYYGGIRDYANSRGTEGQVLTSHEMGSDTYVTWETPTDADPTNELQVLNMSNDTLYLSNGGQVYLGNYANYWTRHGNDIYYNSGHVGVGTDAPGGPLVVKADTSLDPDSALFEVKNKKGQTIFAVYDGGVRVYVAKDTSANKDNVRTHKMGFAVGGLVEEKTTAIEYLRVTPDSTRIWTEDTIAGFGVKSLSGAVETSYMHITPDNYFIGQHSGDSLTTGRYNSTFGYETGKNIRSASQNVFIGHQAGYLNTTGYSNNFIGVRAGYNNNGVWNNFIGRTAGYSNTTGRQNNFMGDRAGNHNTTGNSNVFIGDDAGYSNTTGSYNNFIGASSGSDNLTGTNNNFIGVAAGFRNTIGSYNNFIGVSAGYNNTSGYNNNFYGYNVGYNNVSGYNNNFIGYQAGYSNTTGYENNFIGNMAGYSNTTGKWNDFIGYRAGYSSKTHQQTVAIGYLAGELNDGDWNVFVGSAAGKNDTSGHSNVMVGIDAGRNNNSGNFNTFIGPRAGVDSKGSNCVFIGLNAGSNETGDNKLYIDNNTAGGAIPLIYGEFDNDIVSINGKLGVNNNSPSEAVDIYGSSPNIQIANTDETESGIIFSDVQDPSNQYAKILYNSANNNLSFYNENTAPGIILYDNNGVDVKGLFRAQGATWPTSGAGLEIAYNGVGRIQAYDRDNNQWKDLVLGGDDVIPHADNVSYLGTSSIRWKAVYAVNGTIQTSDRRMKKNIKDINYGLSTVMKLHPVSFDWKSPELKGRNLGLIAQEVLNVVPEVVTVGNDENKTLGMKYTSLIPILIKAIQEQEQKINNLEKENTALKNDKKVFEESFNTLKAEIEQLKEILNAKAEK